MCCHLEQHGWYYRSLSSRRMMTATMAQSRRPRERRRPRPCARAESRSRRVTRRPLFFASSLRLVDSSLFAFFSLFSLFTPLILSFPALRSVRVFPLSLARCAFLPAVLPRRRLAVCVPVRCSYPLVICLRLDISSSCLLSDSAWIGSTRLGRAVPRSAAQHPTSSLDGAAHSGQRNDTETLSSDDALASHSLPPALLSGSARRSPSPRSSSLSVGLLTHFSSFYPCCSLALLAPSAFLAASPPLLLHPQHEDAMRLFFAAFAVCLAVCSAAAPNPLPRIQHTGSDVLRYSRRWASAESWQIVRQFEEDHEEKSSRTKVARAGVVASVLQVRLNRVIRVVAIVLQVRVSQQ